MYVSPVLSWYLLACSSSQINLKCMIALCLMVDSPHHQPGPVWVLWDCVQLVSVLGSPLALACPPLWITIKSFVWSSFALGVPKGDLKQCLGTSAWAETELLELLAAGMSVKGHKEAGNDKYGMLGLYSALTRHPRFDPVLVAPQWMWNVHVWMG